MLCIKKNFPQIKSVDYFSDGCAGQHKNYKAFLNLCHHKSDFDNDATWAFFATSHGKSPNIIARYFLSVRRDLLIITS